MHVPHGRETLGGARMPAQPPLSSRAWWKLRREFVSPSEFADMFGVPPPLELRPIDTVGSPQDRAIRLRMETPRSESIETVVLLPSGKRDRPTGRAIACVSSQPGCGVGCPFCATGQLGFRGNLPAAWIAEQVYWAGHIARHHGRRLRNVVFMGMGEPLHNRAAVFSALDTLIDQRGGFGLAPRHITVSTVGVPTAMVALARRHPQVRQALSLHAATPDLRRRLVPKGVGDLDLLRDAIAQINDLQRCTVWLEIVLLADVNDRQEHIDALERFCRGLRVEVNLIPYNPSAGLPRWQPTCRLRREAIAERLRTAGIRTTIRTSFGQSQRAACGQLTAAAAGGGSDPEPERPSPRIAAVDANRRETS
ncbi:MAG: radical SAM protein [Planctomycetota bacterium]|nr:MAG: radical SAM protein [Planctomycetota bacterium]